jgi:hypothetical protein
MQSYILANKQTLSDIRKTKSYHQKHLSIFLIYKSLATMQKVTQVNIPSHWKTGLDKVVMEWYVQQHACSMTVKGVEI